MEEKQVPDLRIHMNIDAFQTNFADLIQVEANPENVIFNFIQTLPGAPEGVANGKVVSRIAITWPHFARFVGVLQKNMEEGRKHAQASFETFVMGNKIE